MTDVSRKRQEKNARDVIKILHRLKTELDGISNPDVKEAMENSICTAWVGAAHTEVFKITGKDQRIRDDFDITQFACNYAITRWRIRLIRFSPKLYKASYKLYKIAKKIPQQLRERLLGSIGDGSPDVSNKAGYVVTQNKKTVRAIQSRHQSNGTQNLFAALDVVIGQTCA